MHRVIQIFVLAIWAQFAAGDTYEYVGSEWTRLIVNDTVFQSATIEVDCTDGTVSFENIVIYMDPDVYLDAATRSAIREGYLASPLVLDCIERGMTEHAAIDSCRERETVFLRELQAATNKWSEDNDTVGFEQILNRLQLGFADVVEVVRFDSELGYPAYKQRTNTGWAAVMPRLIRPNILSPCEAWTARVKRIVSRLNADREHYRIVHVFGPGSVAHVSCGSAESFEQKIESLAQGGR